MRNGRHGVWLDSLAALDVRGADAAAFLHAQLCGDVLGLAAGKCRFTAWCNPQGRVIASLLIARTGGGFRVVLCRDIAERVRKQLGRFVLRARVEFGNPGEELVVAGAWPASESAWDYLERDGLGIAALPGSKGPRRLLSGAASAIEVQSATADSAGGWTRENVEAGLAWIGLPLSEKFLPQELDLERFQGLSYTKGCYPGQEIIARVHSRGRLKRELRRFSAESAAPAAGERILAADGAGAGLVVAAAPEGTGRSRGLGVVETARVGTEALHLVSTDGPILCFDAG
jgi:hypothetical protein